MAFNASKTPLLKSIIARGFAAQAAQKFAASKANELQVTTLSNQVLVASIDQDAANANVSVVYRAGARDEPYDVQGLTRVLRVGTDLTNKNSSGFRVRKNIEATGGSLTANGDRESFVYTLSLKRGELDHGLEFLRDVATAHDFRSWELKHIPQRIADDFTSVTAADRAIDALHQAAFNRGLGNSLYAASTNLSNITANALQKFVKTNFTLNRVAVVGVGIEHEALLGLAKSFQLDAGNASTTPSKYNAGQLKIDQAGGRATVAIGTQGAASPKESLAFAVLRQIAGKGDSISNNGPSGALAKVVDGALRNPYEFDSFSASYSDNGLFGFVLSADAQEIGKAIDAATKALKSGSVSQGDVDSAKLQLKRSIADRAATSDGRYADLVSQVATGQLHGKSELIAAIDSVSVADVNAAAKKVASGKWSIGGIGNLGNVPHVNELN